MLKSLVSVPERLHSVVERCRAIAVVAQLGRAFVLHMYLLDNLWWMAGEPGTAR